MARPLGGALGSLVGQTHPGPGAGVRADEQAGFPALRGSAAASSDQGWRVPAGRVAGVQGWADGLVGLLGDDGAPGPLGAAHGALDGGRPVLVGAVLTRPLDGQLAHPRSDTATSHLSLLPHRQEITQ